MAQPTKWSSFGFKTQTKKPSQWFWGLNHQTGATGFEAQIEKPEATDFEAKPRETIVTGFEAKPDKTITVVLRPNHW
jgi:hypothetical protein